MSAADFIDAVRDATRDLSVRIDLDEDLYREDLVELRNIQARPARTGAGSEAMRRIVDLADQYGIEVRLHVEPFGDAPLSLRRLKQFYRSFGFVPERLNWMRRKPRIASRVASIEDRIVYHGSNRSDLERLESHFPSYDGGIGEGVYVDFDPETAVFYGDYVYALKLLLRDDEILWLTPYTIEPIEEATGHSILVGEHVEPFWFEAGGERYAVMDAYWEEELGDRYGEYIELDDIGAVAREAGYKAVYLEGVRAGSSVDSELLVFDADDVEMLGRIL